MSNHSAICCANCVEPFPILPYKPSSKFIVSITRSLPDDECEAVDFKPVTILEALNTIFGFTFPSNAETFEDEGSPKGKDCLVLCSKCTEHLAKLYELYCGFKRLCHVDSYISTNKIEGDCKKTKIENGEDGSLAVPIMVLRKSESRISVRTRKALISEKKSSRGRRAAHNGRVQKAQKVISKKTKGSFETAPAVTSGVRTRKQSHPIGLYAMDSASEDGEALDDPHDLLDLEYEHEDDWEPEVRQKPSSPKKPRKQKSKSVAETQAPHEPEPELGSETSPILKRKRGRPRKGEIRPSVITPKRKRGRPVKSAAERASTDPKAPRVFKCQLCGKEAKNNWNLQLHIRGVHEGFRRYQCATCKKYYSNKNFLQNHVKVMHNGESNQFICPEPGCGRGFAYPAGLRVHRLTHTGETKFSCEVCGKGFRRGCDLNDHMTKHTTERPFICEHCGCGFKSRHNLTKHRVIHDINGRFNGKPPPTCDLCNKTFLGVWNLRLHVRTVHEGLKPLKCQICGKGFSSTSNLKVHLYGFHKCPRDANNKVILPPLPFPEPQTEVRVQPEALPATVIQHSPVVSNHFQSHTPHMQPLPLHLHPNSGNHLHSLHETQREEPASGPQYSHLLTSYFNYNIHQ